MRRYDVYCGMDVGKTFHHVHVLDSSGTTLKNHQISQDETKLIALFTELAALGSVLVVVDQPNNIGALTLACAVKSKCDVAYLPGLAMRRAAGLFPGDAKTDELDAEVIARVSLALPESLRPVAEQTEHKADLAILAAMDADITADRTRAINRLHALLLEDHPAFERAVGGKLGDAGILALLKHYGGPWAIRKAGKKRVSNWVAKNKIAIKESVVKTLFFSLSTMENRPTGSHLREEIAIPRCASQAIELNNSRDEVKVKIAEMLKEDKTYNVLLTMPGIGPATAAKLVLYVDITSFPDANHLASYAGLAPKTRQSGTSIKGESCPHIGKRPLKGALFQSAFCALRCDGIARDYYERRRAEGHHHNAIIIALARKRLKIIYVLMRDQVEYRAA